MGLILKIKNSIQRRWIMRNPTSFISWMRDKGVKIGEDFKIAANGPLANITIDMTRPTLISIGDKVTVNKNFTLVTHDFVSGVFLNSYREFVPSSGRVTIGNNVRFGANCTVLKGVNIGDNCFISAGSVVSNDIPANSIASGNPCKVVTTLDTFYKFRQKACEKEAYIYAQSIQQRYGRRPVPTDFWEEFPLFLDKSNIDQFPEIPVRHQLGDVYPVWIENHKALFRSFDGFIDFALSYDASRDENSVRETAGEAVVSAVILDKVREIVSTCTESTLTSNHDKLYMNDVEGWTSLTNMMIIAQVEQKFRVNISAEDMFEMTSLKAIAQVVERLQGTKPQDIKTYRNISELYPHSLLWSKICKRIEEYPAKVAIKVNGKSVTYSSLYENVCKAVSVLDRMGIRRGDCIILSAHKDIEYIYLYFASHILGVTNVIVDAESNAERLNYIEQKTRPRYCFGYKSRLFPSKLFAELDIENAEMMQQSPDALSLSNQDVAEILFTTGTTGYPKGVCLSYANIYGSASNINEFIRNTSEDVELLGLPICHSFGMGRIRCNLLKGATIVILGNFGNVQQVFKTIEEEHVTGFGVVPAAWAYIRKMSGKRIEKFAGQIKYIEIGSASMLLDIKRELLEMFPDTRICMHYGLTEASRICFVEFHDVEHIESIGKPVCDKVDVNIIDAHGKELPYGEKGELCVKGNMVLLRYLEEKDTKDAFYGDYFRTGDCGYKSADGYIYLLGRDKELINVGGKKVSPMEVEDTIRALGVGDCVCIPMKDPDGIMGELVKCYVLRDSTGLSFEQIADGLSDKLENYKRPVVYEWIDQILYTASGKKQRINLK